MAGPIAKESVLKKYNMSAEALNEPSLGEQRILRNLNKTIQDFYREATFELNRDFKLYISYDGYDENGSKIYQTELKLGENIKTSLQVNIQLITYLPILKKISLLQ